MPRLKEIGKGLWGHIIAGLIFLVFIEPILKVTYSLLLSTREYILIRFINHIYRRAAIHATTEELVFVSSVLLLGALLHYMFNAGFRCIQMLKEFRVQEQLFDLGAKGEIVAPDNTSFIKTYEVVTNIIRYLQLMKWIICPCSIVLFFPIFFFLFMQFTTIELNLSFDQRLTAVAPYLKGNEEKMLKSKWATMKNGADFQAINKELEECAQKNNIELPPNLLR